MSPTDWLKYSLFSNLSYVRWNADSTVSPRDLKKASLDAERAPQSLTSSIFDGDNLWSIPSFHSNDDSGFAANVFWNDEEAVLAIRGTEANLIEALPFFGETGLVDLLDADLHDIGTYGFALDQTVSLFNYVMRLQAGANDTAVTQVELHSSTALAGTDPDIDQPYVKVSGGAGGITVDTYYWLEAAAPASGLGVFDGVSNISVTGHSLGGHLAVMAIRLFPELFDAAVTFNAPGFDPVTSLVLTDQFVNLFGEFLTIAPADTFADVEGRITAIESESSKPGDDVSFVASLWTGIPVGQEVLVHTENNSHSMDQIMDALAVHSLVAALNPSLDVEHLLRLYDGMSRDAGTTEESLVGALARTILGREPGFEPVEAGVISHGDFLDRARIHDEIVAIQSEVESRGIVLEPLWDKTPEELAVLAQDSMAYRYAIQNLEPFVVLGDESLYPGLSAEESLSTAAHSNAYWVARAGMLLGKFNLGVTDGELDETTGQVVVYSDLADGVEVSVMTADGDIPPHTTFAGELGTGLRIVNGTDSEERLFGGAGADRLAGGAGSDVIDGGGGSDTLYAGNPTGSSDDGVVDWLEGGSGADFYYVGSGDVISDSDRIVAGIVLSGWSVAVTYEWLAEGVFQSTDGGRTLEITGNDALITLHTLPTPTTVTLLNFAIPGSDFREDDFGVSLVFPDSQESPTSDIQIVGTQYDDNHWEEYGDLASLVGTNGNEGIAGLEGNDFIETRLGVDFVDAGPGNDVVRNVDVGWGLPDLAGDIFNGGAGNDALTGNAGSDWLLGGEGDDFLQGGGGTDLLSGGSGDEVIFGGDGDDIIYGGTGDDIVDGDKGLIDVDAENWLREDGDPLNSSWLGLESVEPAEQGVPYGSDSIWGGAGRDYLMGGAGADVLFGESGRDTLRGGYGDDLLAGGSHVDALSGGEGDDELLGGDGNDRLNGGPGQDVLAGGLGSDRYEYVEGDGWDRIREPDHEPGARNWVLFPLDHYSGAYQLSQSGNDLIIEYLQDDAGIIVENWFSDPESVLDEVHFSDRTWNIADMAALVAGQGTRWSDTLYGGEGDDWFLAGAGGDYGIGGDGDDVIFGGDGADELLGEAGNDTLYGGAGWDYIEGGAGDDILVAGDNPIPREVDSLAGGEGSDTYIVDAGSGGRVYIVDVDAEGDDRDVVRLLGDVRLEDLAVHRVSVGTYLTAALEIDFVPEFGGAAVGVTIFNWFESLGGEIEAIELGDGTVITAEEINARLDVPTNGRDYLLGSGGDVTLFGMAGDDVLIGAGDRNELHGGAGSDQLSGSGGENLLMGGVGQDRLQIAHLQSTSGDPLVSVDILLGGAGEDLMESSAGSFSENEAGVLLMDGGSEGDELIIQGAARAIVAGGQGFDFITGDLSAVDSVILLNRGEQGDVISNAAAWDGVAGETPPEAGSHVVSFGGGITLDDISIGQDENDLLINTGSLEGLRLVDYFDSQGEPAKWLTHIQIVNQASSGYESDSATPEASSPIIFIDFNLVLADYLEERTGPGEIWRLIDADTEHGVQFLQDHAIGGQVVYEYALLGSDVHTHLADEVWDAMRAFTDASEPVVIQILPTEPVAGIVMEALLAPEDEQFRFRVPENFIIDPLTQESLQVVLESELPEWLNYDPLTRECFGSPGQEDIGTVTVSFSATNRFGQETSVSFDIVTQNTNDLPVVSIPAGNIVVVAGKAFYYSVPPGMFLDEDPNDHVTVSIASLTGEATPDWVHFDPETGTLSGMPPLSATGATAVVIVATDSAGGSVGTTLTLTVESGSSNDGQTITGTVRSDSIVGTDGNDTLSGGGGRDELHGRGGDDNLDGGTGSDLMFGGPGQDRLFGGAGADVLAGEDGSDVILGGRGSDRISGGAGDDYLSGERGKDRMMGDDGNDILVTEHGNDRLAGGAGNDTYVVLAGAGNVTIIDSIGNDAIQFGPGIFSADARFFRHADDLMVRLQNSRTKVVVADWFANTDTRIEGFIFGDAVTLLEQDVLQLVQQRAGFAAQAPFSSGATDFAAGREGLPFPLDMVALLEGGAEERMLRWLP